MPSWKERLISALLGGLFALLVLFVILEKLGYFNINW